MSSNAKMALTGFEIELFTLDSDGNVIGGADSLLKKAKSGSGFTVKKECALNMVEIASDPGTSVPAAMGNLLSGIGRLLSVAGGEGMMLCPLSTYPGKFTPSMRTEKPYQIKEAVFGKKRFSIAGRCVGFHCHHTLPRSVFDMSLKVLKSLVISENKDTLVSSYNFLTAADPALTCFMQSSPFYQGMHMGKDSRVIMYRGGKELLNMDGLYAKHRDFGGLLPYRYTAFDIMELITARYERWKSYVRKLEVNVKTLSLYGSVLDTTWNPVKINPNGTLEQRGMDMNHPTLVTGSGLMIRYALSSIRENGYVVTPSEIGIKSPFKIEGRKLYIPPFTYLKNELQKRSAYRGLEDGAVHDYCRSFLRFASKSVPNDEKKLLRVMNGMIEDKKTVSDEVLSHARKLGFRKGGTLTGDAARDVAIRQSEIFADDAGKLGDMLAGY